MSIVVPSQFVTSAAVFPLPSVPEEQKAAPKRRRIHSAPAFYEDLGPPCQVPGSYAEVMAVLKEPDYLNKYYNAGHFRSLRTLEAAMDFLAVKLAYRIDQNDVVRFNVRRTLGNDNYTGLDRVYDVQTTLRGSRGCVVRRLLPRDGSKDVLLVFRGTQKQVSPSGLRANTEFRGAGRAAFTEVREQVEGWVREACAAGQHVNIVGHSLGGAIGMRLLAALPEESQAQCNLFGAQMPRSWPEVVQRIANDGRNMFACINPRDLIAYGGKCLPKGARIVCAPVNGWRGHCLPALASQEFNKLEIVTIPYKPSILRFLPIETARVVTGIVRGRRFPF